MITTNRTFVVGDFHGDLDIRKVSNKNWPEQKELTKDDVLIQLGDFGLVWSSVDKSYWLDWLGNRNCTFAFVDGNHENHDLLDALPTTEKWDGKVKVIETENKPLYQLMRGEVYKINGKTIMAAGGADSIDKLSRVIGRSWWERELWSRAEEENALTNATINNIDIVVAHTCPTTIAAEILRRVDMALDDPALPNRNRYQDKIKCPVGRFFEYLINYEIQPQQWHFGHWHEDMIIDTEAGTEFFCHYRNKPMEIL
jgi:hypothetical protein